MQKMIVPHANRFNCCMFHPKSHPQFCNFKKLSILLVFPQVEYLFLLNELYFKWEQFARFTWIQLSPRTNNWCFHYLFFLVHLHIFSHFSFPHIEIITFVISLLFSFPDINRNHHNWLQLEKKVLDHDFPTKSGILTLYFRVQFFMESINQLRDSITIELFYLQAKESVFKVSAVQIFKLEDWTS